MREGYEQAFKERRKEWTVRKHRILALYFKVAAAKLKGFGNRLAFVDGFAGANQYGDEAEGSTRLMLAAAKEAKERYGTTVIVHACEVNAPVRDQLRSNLAADIASGLLTVHDVRHADAIAAIRQQHGREPLVVFLDPNRPTQMSIEDDIAPWADRPQTDVLGLYFGQQVHRIIEGAKQKLDMEGVATTVGGESWMSLETGDQVFEDFVARISGLKPYVGMYRLRKFDSGQIVYGIFGISGHIAGYHLLSEAVAYDHSRIEEAKRRDQTGSLFEGDPLLDEELNRFQGLVEIARPILADSPDLKGKKLAEILLDAHRGELFGQYAERDYNRAIKQIRAENGGSQ